MSLPEATGPAPSVSTGTLFLVILTFAVAFNTLYLTVIPEGRPLRIACAALPSLRCCGPPSPSGVRGACPVHSLPRSCP